MPGLLDTHTLADVLPFAILAVAFGLAIARNHRRRVKPNAGHGPPRLELRFRTLGTTCDFLKDGNVLATFTGGGNCLESRVFAPYTLDAHPTMMVLKRGMTLNDPLGVKSRKVSRVKPGTGHLEIDLGDRVFHLFRHDRMTRRRTGSSIFHADRRVATFWEPRGVLSWNWYLDAAAEADLSDAELVLLAFFANYLPEALKATADDI